jgi:hypothetical protein
MLPMQSGALHFNNAPWIQIGKLSSMETEIYMFAKVNERIMRELPATHVGLYITRRKHGHSHTLASRDSK